MPKFRKKPVVIDAFQYAVDEAPAWFKDRVGKDVTLIEDVGAKIKTLEGEMLAPFSCMIIRGVHGEIYPCALDIFEETYEPAD